MSALLEARHLDAGYGSTQILWDVSLSVDAGSLVALVGSNGAGKTTLLRTLSGLIRPYRGEIVIGGRPCHGADSSEILAQGMVLVPEGRRLFSGMTVRENLMMGAYLRRDRTAVAADLERVFGFFPILKERQGQLAGKLSGGEQQMCAIARGLMSQPRILAIDELSLGLAPVVVDKLLGILRQIHASGQTIILVEQDVHVALEIADHAYVLETGRVVRGGRASEILADEAIVASYLGSDEGIEQGGHSSGS